MPATLSSPAPVAVSAGPAASPMRVTICRRNRLWVHRGEDGRWSLGESAEACAPTPKEEPVFALGDHPVYIRRHPAPDVPGPGEWLSLDALEAVSPFLDVTLRALVTAIGPYVLEMNYLGFGRNQFIYKFRPESQRNRAIYQDDPTSQSLYQSQLCAAIKALRRRKENQSDAPAMLDFGAVRYVLPSHFGFCLGVQNAIERAYEVVAENPNQRVFMLSELIHNPFVNEDLQRRGLRYLQSDKGKHLRDPATGKRYWNTLTEDDIVVIPAFGATNEDKVRLIRKGLAINEYDATCMLVEKVWKAARRFGEDGYTVVIHGKAEHEETKATFSNTARYAPALIVRDAREAARLGEVIQAPDPETARELLEAHFGDKMTPQFDAARHLEKIAVVNQTTLLRNETLKIIAHLEDVLAAKYGAENVAEHLHPGSKGDTLCYATQVNQDALGRALDVPLDAALVAGGKNSSNTFQLYRLCAAKLGANAAYIQSEANLVGPGEVEHFHFAQNPTDPRAGTLERRLFPVDGTASAPQNILLTGGASCPDGIIQQIMTRLNGWFPAERLRGVDAVLADLA